jgi:hypothetical protein
MGVRLDFEYLGGEQNSVVESPGDFVRSADDAPWSRIPAIGEAITMAGHWVVRVTWVLWPMVADDDIVIHVETHPGYEPFVPTRAELTASGWREA